MASSSLPALSQSERAAALREALATRVVIADGGMGTMLQAHNPTLEDFRQLDGCNEILNLTRPDIVRAIHRAYFAVGVDCVETNTFGANLSALSEYEIADRVLVVESGKIVEQDTPERLLLESGGRYAALHAAWAASLV